MIVLDTHVWLWGAGGDERALGSRTRRLVERSHDAVGVSTASIFEIAALHAAGRLRLARPPDQWVRDSIRDGGLRVLELSVAAAIDAGSLPRTALADPLDRLIVATARQHDAALVTADAKILAYAAGTKNVRVHDARR